MKAYNIKDLMKGKYTHEYYVKTGFIKRIKLIETRRGILYKIDDEHYVDLISNNVVLNDSIVGDLEPFKASEGLITRDSVIYIFSELNNVEGILEPTIRTVRTTETNVFEETLDKVKSLGSKFRK